MKYHQIQSFSDSRIRSLFGLSGSQLGELLAQVLPVLCQRRRQVQLAKPNRQRAPGAGAKRSLTPTQEVLLALVYLRHNVSHAVCGGLFGVSADKSEAVFHEVVPVLQQVCPSDRWNAQKRWKKSEPTWKPTEIDHLLVDSFETSIPRPSDPDKQRRLYSGKKKRHTLKTQVATDARGEILQIDPGHRGPLGDKTLYEQSSIQATFPGATKQADLGYLGVADMRVPHRRKNCRNIKNELTHQQKIENQKLASTRVPVEHAIRRIKGWKTMRQDFRLATGLFPMVAHTVVGLVQLARICP